MRVVSIAFGIFLCLSGGLFAQEHKQDDTQQQMRADGFPWLETDQVKPEADILLASAQSAPRTVPAPTPYIVRHPDYCGSSDYTVTDHAVCRTGPSGDLQFCESDG